MEIITKKKKGFETTTFVWVCLGIPSHAQTSLDLPRVPLGSHEGIATLRVIQNELVS